MWIVAKINNNQQELFKKNFQDKFKENIKFYYPKIEGQKRFSNKSKKKINLIGNYIFCYSENFIFNSIEKFNFIKGLSYFLKNCKFYQKEIKSFVETCKAAESNDGFIVPIIDEVLARLPDKVAAYKKGKKNLIGLFMGEVMKAGKGKVDPKKANELIRKQLEKA